MRYKYPRTYHLPFSPGFTSDDKVLKDDSQFYGKRVVVTEKWMEKIRLFTMMVVMLEVSILNISHTTLGC